MIKPRVTNPNITNLTSNKLFDITNLSIERSTAPFTKIDKLRLLLIPLTYPLDIKLINL